MCDFVWKYWGTCGQLFRPFSDRNSAKNNLRTRKSWKTDAMDRLIWSECNYLDNLLCKRHFKASSDFAERILGDHQHSLHGKLSNSRSHTSTRSRFMLLPSKNAAYRNSVLLALSWLLVDRNADWTITYRICLYVLIPLPLLYYCPSFYYQKFVQEEEAENFTFSVK